MKSYQTTLDKVEYTIDFSGRTVTAIDDLDYQGITIEDPVLADNKITFKASEGTNKTEYAITATVSNTTRKYIGGKIIVVDDDLVEYYGSVFCGNLYFGDRLNSEVWLTANNSDRRKALIEATQLIDRFNFVGDKTDDNQKLEFPRDGNTIVPYAVEYAAYEVAMSLLSGKTLDVEMEKMEVEKDEFESVKTTYAKGSQGFGTFLLGPKAYSYLIPYLRNRGSVVLRRNS